MNKFSIALICAFGFYSFSCSQESNKNCISLNTNEPYTLEKNEKSVISFDLDSISSSKINYLKLIELNDTLFLTFLNPYNNHIYCYDYETKKFHSKIPLSSPKKLSGYEIISWEKIITYQYWSYEMTLQDGKGKILKRMIIPPQKGDNGYYAFPNSHSPIIYKQDSIYLAGGHMSDKKADSNSHIVAQIDTSLTKVNYLYNFPKIYTEMFFGGANYRMDISYVYNPDKDLFIFSFPSSHKLYTTKDFKVEHEYCVGSKFFNSIPEYRYDTNKSLSFKYATENGFYYSIVYDKYNKLYYRICLLPTEYKIAGSYTRNLSIIILDSEFNILGEKLLKNGQDYDISSIQSICVSPDGILMQKKNDLIEESALEFISYELLKVK